MQGFSEDDVNEEGMEDHRMRSEWKMWKTREGDVEESLKQMRGYKEEDVKAQGKEIFRITEDDVAH